MSHKNNRERSYTQPPTRPAEAQAQAEADDTDDRPVTGLDEPARKRRHASVYDAVAGRVTSTLPLVQSNTQHTRATHHKPHAPDARRDPTLAPEEVLFRRSAAPVRFAEKDIYMAHEKLLDGGRDILPDCELVKSIHSYASHFYRDLSSSERTAGGEAEAGISERSMDESALLAFGILLEEASREALGKNGDLVFTEGMEVGEHGPSQSEDENVEVFGFKDALKYETRGRLKRPRA